jgi:putative component of membrane protein insertase Oxa1/YidC/SpoIIIJ protein YidD
MKLIILSAIRFYQRAISPYKGFRCAYAAHTGHASCSALGYRAIRRWGVWHGFSVLDRRLHKCGIAHRRYRPAALGRQAGFLDCGDCDVGACDVLDALSNCSNCGSCDWRRRNRGDDQYVVIPARGNVR